MQLKLPPKLKSPYTLAEWMDLEYDKDPKFTKALKLLNLALKNLKATKPPSPEAFGEFTEQTAYLIKRIKKMLADQEMPVPVREFCESFYLILRKWQKGAVKLQDILMEESEEDAAQSADAEKSMKQALTQAQSCIKNYTTLAQTVDKALKDITQLATIVNKGVASPKLDAAVEHVRTGKLQKSMDAALKNCTASSEKLPDSKEINQVQSSAKEQNNSALSALASTCLTQLAALGKVSKAVELGMAKYAKTTADLLKTFDARKRA